MPFISAGRDDDDDDDCNCAGDVRLVPNYFRPNEGDICARMMMIIIFNWLSTGAASVGHTKLINGHIDWGAICPLGGSDDAADSQTPEDSTAIN